MAKELHHIEIHLSDPRDGKFHGAAVEHHFEREVAHGSARGMYMGDTPEPEKYHFGEHEGPDMLAHVANHMGVKEPEHDKANIEKLKSATDKFLSEEEKE